MACPLCGDDCRCSHAQLPVFSAAQSNEDVVLPAALRGTGFTAKTFSSHDQSPISVLIDPETKDSEQQFAAGVGIENKADLGSLPESGFSTPLPDFYAANSAIWREEVASRVQNYRTRRRRRKHPSLSLDFGAPASRASSAASEQNRNVEPRLAESRPAERSQPEVAARILPVEPKLIEFPRLLAAANPAEELAEPVLFPEKPRILDAPEMPDNALPMPLLAGITMDTTAPEDSGARARSTIELPLQVAPATQRVFSALIDGVLVLLAAAIFAFIASKIAPPILERRASLTFFFLLPAFLWAFYHYIFLVYAATTPGMQMAQLAPISFECQPLTRNGRRWRALAMIISCAPLGLGLLWMFVDEDMLCWHDRISRSYLAQRE